MTELSLVTRSLFLISAVVLLTALGFEHVGGYAPCPLCLQQRYAYYAALILLLLGLLCERSFPRVLLVLLVVVGLGYLLNAVLGIYHAGVEWHFWAGPQTCATEQALPVRAQDLLADLSTARVVRCDEAAWRFLGLSFAGWNVLLSLSLSGGAFWGAWRFSHKVSPE